MKSWFLLSLSSRLSLLFGQSEEGKGVWQVKGKLAKNDKIEAKVFVHYGEAIKPEETKLPEERMGRIRELVVRRGQIVKMKVAERKRLKQARDEKVRGSIIKVLCSLEGSMKGVDREIEEELSFFGWRARRR